jgi:hypothetical protein
MLLNSQKKLGLRLQEHNRYVLNKPTDPRQSADLNVIGQNPNDFIRANIERRPVDMLNDLKNTIQNKQLKSQFIKEKAAVKLIAYLFGETYQP